jgi:hypothetical protein
MFDDLRTRGAMDDKTTAYVLQWQIDRGRFRDFGGASLSTAYTQFQFNLVEAASNTKCTVRVFTSNGQNAEIKAAKADKRFEGIGQSTVVKEMERAKYFFQCWRNNKKTGETSEPYDCTGKSQDITITEN